ncbi:hypothetical protein [Streptomyces cacaoi]|uniref:hypothetical protein n=1 Tax=Streptomyces cacaoi TaxID=1898 RepID=UPI003749D554
MSRTTLLATCTTGLAIATTAALTRLHYTRRERTAVATAHRAGYLLALDHAARGLLARPAQHTAAAH